MASFPLERNGLPVAAGENRLSFGGLIDKTVPVIGTPDEFLASDAIHRYIDCQRGRSPEAQAKGFVLRVTIEAIDFAIEPKPHADIENPKA